MTRANSLKKSIKQILQLADKNNTINSMLGPANIHFPSGHDTISNSESTYGKNESLRNSIISHDQVNVIDSDTKKLIVQKIENLDDEISYRHVTYDDYDDDFDFGKMNLQTCDSISDFELNYENNLMAGNNLLKFYIYI